MTANETYKVLRSVLGPWFRDNGFKGAKGYLTYQRRAGEKCLTVRFQCHHQGWDKYKGSSFAVFVHLSNDPAIEYVNLRRLTEYLSLGDLEFIRARQNRILASIPQPPAEHIKAIVSGFEKAFRDPQPYIDIYIRDWKPVARPYSPSDDIWLRYFSEDHVRSWAILLHKYLQNVHDNLADMPAS